MNKFFVSGSAASIFASAVGPRPLLERPNEGGSAGADTVVREFKSLHADIKAALQEVGVKNAGIEERMSTLEQKLARSGGSPGGMQTKSWGQQFVESPELKSFSDDMSRPGRFRLDVKTTITSDAASGGALVAPHRDGVVSMPRRRLTIRNLLPVISVSSGSVEYPKQTGRTNAAATVAEAAAKPESAYAFDLETVPVRTIAHWVPASRQILDDAPQLAGMIDSELRYGLMLKEEDQILSGDGTGQNLHGLIPQATAYAAPITLTSPTMIDMLGLAILQCALADLPADGIVIHPSDWMRMRLLKNSDGEYILGDPSKAVEPVLFGLPVVQTPAIAVDKFLVGNFQVAGTIYDRWAPRVEVSTEHSDFFTRNLVAVLCEERLALAVKKAEALTYGDFGNVA